ncbi:MAG: 50S ribosomal protein L4 [Planctomycetes bacterium]|nr:50S ribosomal protein L4 [Planctomycetota bacterium]
MIDLQVRDRGGKEAGTVHCDPADLGGRVRRALLRQILIGYEANRRAGTHKSKTRAEVNYSYNKLWSQKGTGNARMSGRASPLWRHGGTTFGPVPRSYRQRLPRQMRRGALRSALLTRVLDGKVYLLTDLAIDPARAKGATALLRALAIERGCLVVTEKDAPEIYRAFRNQPRVAVRPARELNAWDVMRYPCLVMARACWETLVASLRSAGSGKEAAA